MDEVFIPIAFFLMITAIVVVPTWLKSRERREMQETLRASVERGQPLPADVIEALSRKNVPTKPTAARDLRLGVILLSVAGGIGLTFWMLGNAFDTDLYGMAAWAAIPGCVGLAFIVLSFFNKNKD